MSRFKININETIFLLSDSLNLVSDHQINHAKRVAYLAAECVKALDWDSKQIDDLFLASILHDCGISNSTLSERVSDFKWETAENHCTRGAQLLKRSAALAHLSEFVLYHHTNWQDIIPIDIWDKVKISANCIYMVDTIDLYLFQHLSNDANILTSKENIRRIIHSKQTIDFADLKTIISIFSNMVDSKSYYTKNHSAGVASLSRCLGKLFELTEHSCDKLELAGLLHDLGKLRVPLKILNKTDVLSEAEFFIMQRHSYDTYEILKNIQGFEDFPLWASQHHERLDGSGYPYRHNSKELSLEARIIAIADVFQAYSQNRPHRERLMAKEILAVLKIQVDEGKLDKDIVLMIESNLDICWDAANLITHDE